MLKLSSRANARPANANSSGIGYRNRPSRPNAQQAAGSVINPDTATSFRATPYASTLSTATTSSAGTTM